MNVLTLKIENARNDGCTVLIRDGGHGELAVQMRSQNGGIVDEGLIPKAELFDWIDTRRDW